VPDLVQVDGKDIYITYIHIDVYTYIDIHIRYCIFTYGISRLRVTLDVELLVSALVQVDGGEIYIIYRCIDVDMYIRIGLPSIVS